MEEYIMKKILAVLLVLAMTLGLAACGGSSAPAATEAPAAPRRRLPRMLMKSPTR